MRQGFRRPAPATIVALTFSLVALLGGTVYAATRIDGRTIRVKSLPGNRLKPGSVPANRLKPGVLSGRVAGPITGSQIDERSLGQVPSAAYADIAGTAQTAVDAQTAVNAVNAVDALTVNGHEAGCQPGTRPFAGACWQTSANESPVTAPVAAAACAAQDGTLPEALQLAAFAQQPDVTLKGEEWSANLTNYSGSNAYGVLTVSATSVIEMALPSAARNYRCVIPIVV
jgi:hypothetical protein